MELGRQPGPSLEAGRADVCRVSAASRLPVADDPVDGGEGDWYAGQVGGWRVQRAGGEGGQVGAVSGGDAAVEVPGGGGQGGRGGVAVQGLQYGQRLVGADGAEVGAARGAAELRRGHDAPRVVRRGRSTLKFR